MITRNEIKYIHSLKNKRTRDVEGLFVGEGPKVVSDLLPLMRCRTLYATPDYFGSLKDDERLSSALRGVERIVEITPSELDRLSLLKSPREALAIFYKKERIAVDSYGEVVGSELCLALDGVQDPGNLGTIVRVADWFGITRIFASLATADVYAPKVVQATMGAIGRVEVVYLDLSAFLKRLPAETLIYGTFLDGENLYEQDLCNRGVIVMGNEGGGITLEVSEAINRRLFIPNYPPNRPTSESLNVAIATAITCAAFRRL